MASSLSLRGFLFSLLLPLCASSLFAKTLKITSTPPGATVELNDEIVGTTPFEQDFPSSYFRRPAVSFEKRLEHPIRLRLTLSGYVTKELILTKGPKQWLDLHHRNHGEYWLFKADEFRVDLPALPTSSQKADGVSFRNVSLFSLFGSLGRWLVSLCIARTLSLC